MIKRIFGPVDIVAYVALILALVSIGIGIAGFSIALVALIGGHHG